MTTNDDGTEYEMLYATGVSPEELCLIAAHKSCSFASIIRMLRTVCDLSFIEAKEIWITSQEIASSVDDYQGCIAKNLEASIAEKILDF